jgi:hypothetical protein
VGVGYFVMVPPLSVGTGAFKFSDDPADYFRVDMTYHVTVQ